MNHKLIVSGVLFALLAVSMNASAYHITGVAGSVAGPSAHTYDSATSVPGFDEPCVNSLTAGLVATIVATVITVASLVDPGLGAALAEILTGGCIFDPALTANDTLFALTLCETDDEGFGFPGTVSAAGHGGLCSMSPGYTTGSSCAFSGLSDGFGPNYDGTPANTCEDVNAGDSFGIIAGGAADYYKFTMGTSGDVSYQVNGITCTNPSGSAIVDMKYAYLTDAGHVTGFANVAGDSGTYTVATATAPGGDCATGTPAPIYTA